VASTDGAPNFDIRRYAGVIRRRRILIVATALVVAAGAVLITEVQTPTYRGSAEIVFTSTPSPLDTSGTAESLDPARDIQTQITVLTSAPVRMMVASTLHVAVAPSITATPAANANAITVTATSTDPVEAAMVANAYANAYISYRKTSALSDLLDAEQLIQGRITSLQTQIDALTTQINAAKPAAQADVEATLGPQRDALLTEQSSLKQQLDQTQLQSAFASTGAQLGSPAAIPSAPASIGATSAGIAALAVGLLIGVVLAFVVDFLDDSVKSRDDVRQSTGLPILGLVPSVAGWRASTHDTRVVSLSAPMSQAAESYRAVRTAVEFTSTDRSMHILQVTSPNAGEGKSTTAANLSIALARAGRQVCVVGADLRRPRIHEFFGMSNDRGWISVVQGNSPLSSVLQQVEGVPNAWLLTSGNAPADPSELLGSGRMEGLLASLAARFDIVLIDSAPVLPVADASVLAGRVDGVILVCKGRDTKKRALTSAVELLRQVDAPLVGVVFNCADDDLGRGYGYGYGYTEEVRPVPKRGAGHAVTGPSAAGGQDRSRVHPTKV